LGNCRAWSNRRNLPGCGFTTQDLTRCRLLAGTVALVYNWWSLFTRLADPQHHREAITSRPLLLAAIARRTQHAGQVTLTITSTHGMRDKARQAYIRIAGFLAEIRENAEQLDAREKWYRFQQASSPAQDRSLPAARQDDCCPWARPALATSRRCVAVSTAPQPLCRS
jgi:hypothetical protein